MTSVSIQPRVIRHRDAAAYLGVNVGYFNQHIRPHLTEVRFGPQMVAFDRCELDAWFDKFKSSNGRPASEEGRNNKCRPRNKKSRVSNLEEKLGGSTKKSLEEAFARAVEQAITRRPRNIYFSE